MTKDILEAPTAVSVDLQEWSSHAGGAGNLACARCVLLFSLGLLERTLLDALAHIWILVVSDLVALVLATMHAEFTSLLEAHRAPVDSTHVWQLF